MKTRIQTGRIRILHFFYMGIVGLALYVGFQMSSFWISAYELESFMNEKVRTSEIISDGELRLSIETKSEELGIPVSGLTLQIDRTDKTVTVTAEWVRTYEFWGLYQYSVSFSKRAAVNFK